MYSGWWNVYLRGLNLVLLSSRIQAAIALMRLLLAAVLLLAGAGLLSLPLATLATSFIQRHVSRRFVLRFVSAPDRLNDDAVVRWQLLRILWPNCWRVGVHCLGYYLVPHAATLICAGVLGLQTNAKYGLSVQIVAIIQSMTAVWVSVKWPEFGQFIIRKELDKLRFQFRARLLFQMVSFAVISAVALSCSTDLLSWLDSGKTTIEMDWFALIALAAFLDLHSNTWVTLIALGNKLPFLWHSVATNVATIVLAFVLVRIPSLGIGGLIIAPIITNLFCNYWMWPIEGAKSLGTTWRRFMCVGRANAPVGQSKH